MLDYLPAILGGVLIALASSLLLLSLGKITGISGIIANVFSKDKFGYWRACFLFGLIAGGVILKLYDNSYFEYDLKFGYMEAIIAGLLVGFGTRLGNGCTSGHGVCGIARLSTRSFVATCTFMVFAIVTVFVQGKII